MDIKPAVSAIFNDATFVKSQRCNASVNCIEVARRGTYIGIRDSKNRSGPVLVFTQQEWGAFVEGVDDGDFSSI